MPESTYDLTAPVGRVRLLIPDKKPGKMRWDDDEIGEFLVMEGMVEKAAAALALEVMATNKADCVGYIATNAIKLDGTKPANVMLERAAMLRAQAAPAPEGDEWEFGALVEDWR